MGKKFIQGLVALIGLMVFSVVAFLMYLLHVHDEGIGVVEPYTMEELRALSAVLDPAGVTLPEGVEDRLTNVMTDEEYLERYEYMDAEDHIEWWLRNLSTKLEDGFAQSQGRPSLNAPHVPAFVGGNELFLGDLDTARRYLWVAVDRYKTVDLDQCRFALRSLAELERDPERAALLLQLSCQGSGATGKSRVIGMNVAEAYRVCEESNTPKLAEYYKTRLLNKYPKQAEEYGVKKKVSNEEESP
jgi:hypothetical protein